MPEHLVTRRRVHEAHLKHRRRIYEHPLQVRHMKQTNGKKETMIFLDMRLKKCRPHSEGGERIVVTRSAYSEWEVVVLAREEN